VNAYGVMAGVLIGSLVTLVPLYLPVLNRAVGCAWARAIVYTALSAVSAVVLRDVLSSNN